MTSHKLIGIAAFLIAAGLAGCGDKIDPLFGPSDGGDGGSTSPTYVQDIKPILDQFCVVCHSTSKSGAERNGALETVNFDTYELAVANSAAASIRLQAGSMPPPPNPAPSMEQVNLFLEWVAAGTPRGAI